MNLPPNVPSPTRNRSAQAGRASDRHRTNRSITRSCSSLVPAVRKFGAAIRFCRRNIADLTGTGHHSGGCEPGDRNHVFTCAAVSAWRAFRTSSSRRMPGGMPSACLRKFAASSNRPSSAVDWLKGRRCNMALLPVWIGRERNRRSHHR